MAPCSTSFSSAHHIRVSDRDSVKLRKPLVEKMRRDRINTCIEQLKIILEKEFHKQEPNSKLEKADILEMTVSFLRQQLQPGLSAGDYSRGYSHCWRDSVHFLSAGCRTPTALAPLQEQQHPQAQRAGSSTPACSPTRPDTLQDSSSSSSSSSSRGPVWRPW